MLTIALLQIAAHGFDQAANLETGERASREARAAGADIALFPEMWNIGYTGFCPDANTPGNTWRTPEHWTNSDRLAVQSPELAAAREAWHTNAIARDSPFVQHFRNLARELEMAIALTYMEQWPVAPRNTVSLIDRHGEIVLTYAKVHTCAFDINEDRHAISPGDGFPVHTLDTAAGPVRIGAMICYDREFPESARVLMLNGAEIILVPNACGMDQHRLTQLRTRATENMVGVAMTNYPAPPTGNGHSAAYDPIAYDDGGYRDTLVTEAGESAGIYLARFDLGAIRDYRERETWGNAFRRPSLYGALVSPDALPPFERVDPNGDPPLR